MARGTGLPFPRDDEVIKPAPGINADAYSSAAAWGQIAQAGHQITKLGLDRLEKAKHQAEVGYLAGHETEITRKKIELKDQYSKDPAGFDREWQAYSSGKLQQTEAWAVPHVQKYLGHAGNAGYSYLLDHKRANDERLDQHRLKALADQSADEVIGAALAGKMGEPEGEAALLKLRAVHQSAVSAGLMTPEEADLRFQNTTSKAGAESVVKVIGDAYKANRAKGLEAGAIAEKMAEDMLLRTEDPRLVGLSERERHHYYGEALAGIRRLEVERRNALTEAKKSARETMIAAHSGANVPEDLAEEIVGELTANGGHADAARFRAGLVREQIMRPFKGLPTTKQIETFNNIGGALGVHAPPDVREAIAEAAEKTGVPRSYLFSTARKESNFDPNARANTSTAGGLFQFIDSTWREMLTAHGAKYGLGPDTPKTDARANALMAGELAKQNGDVLKAAGLPVTDTTLYLAHFAGAGGAVKMLQANPDALAADVLPNAAKANPTVFYAKDGGARTVRETIQRLSGGMVNAGSPGVDLRLLSGMKGAMASTAAAEWKTLSDAIDKNPGAMPDPARVNSIIQAATLAGDHHLLEQIGRDLDFGMAGQVFGRAKSSLQKGALAELRASTTLQPGEVRWMGRMEAIIKDTDDKLKNDPIALGVQNFPETFKTPVPFDFSSADKATAGLAERVKIVQSVGINYGDQTIQALGKADRAQFVSVITGSDTKQKGIALDTLANLPDDNFAATLTAPEIKEAILGAAHSNDPATYTAAMMSLDKMWARAPQEFDKIFGGDAVKEVQDWQMRRRYHKPEELAEALRSRDDPGIQKHRKELEREAYTQVATTAATRMTIEKVTGELDPGWFTTGPNVPTDPRVVESVMADYYRLYAERYAAGSGRDKAMAHKQAMERLKLYWSRSELNGGELSLYAPERTYHAINGSHDWMRKEIEADIRALRVNPKTFVSSPADFDMSAPDKIGADDYAPPQAVPYTAPPAFRLQAYRETESDVTAGRPARYMLFLQNRAGEWDHARGPDNKPLVYWFDRHGGVVKSREEFERQRKNIHGVDSPRGDGSQPWGMP